MLADGIGGSPAAGDDDQGEGPGPGHLAAAALVAAGADERGGPGAEVVGEVRGAGPQLLPEPVEVVVRHSAPPAR